MLLTLVSASPSTTTRTLRVQVPGYGYRVLYPVPAVNGSYYRVPVPVLFFATTGTYRVQVPMEDSRRLVPTRVPTTIAVQEPKK